MERALPRLPIALLVAYLVVVAPSLGQPLLEAHAFRQTQTAYTALVYHQQGIDLLRPEIPVFGPPWVVPFEFPLFQAAGALLMEVFPPDMAMRVAGLASFLLAAWLLYLLARRVSGMVATVTLAAFLFSPFGILWGRTSMIEYLAVAGGLGFLLAGLAWRDGARWAWLPALVVGSIGALVKSTTGLVFLLPLLAYRGAWRDWRSYALIAVPTLLSFAWTAYADGVKASSPETAWLTTSALRDWYFLDGRDQWEPVVRVLLLDLAGLGLAIPFGILAARGFVRWFLAAALLPLVVIWPMYAAHSYYFAAISPMIALSVGLGVGWLWERRSALGLAAVTACWLLAAVVVADHWLRIWWGPVDPSNVLPAAEYVAARSDPGDIVTIDGREWDPAVWYYARRRGGPEGDVAFRCPYFEPCS